MDIEWTVSPAVSDELQKLYDRLSDARLYGVRRSRDGHFKVD